ncbi:hypothetical protein GCM10025867_51080 (plasmid) [Frondihabitans sucicola]|uniref:Transposase n=1 Tax=Frondihabitans sucicola TaxID=1268041 RepID=A0ABN6Y688_9MICO|nr:hypothetical protein [Frondihabitans sucicola]BDZ52301.1 hypothetical protein GCM10025867_45420 [Frondihabitans sucicola]BDZ52867.1 hypothetical protein GCM10025867_51080 [Frondihabitans sucicola]
MPFEQKYTPETRQQATDEVLARRAANPKDRSMIRETAEKYQVGEQSLRGWIKAYDKANEPEPKSEPVAAPAPAVAPAAAAPAREVVAAPALKPAPVNARIAELEAEVAKLTRDKAALKGALRILLDD